MQLGGQEIPGCSICKLENQECLLCNLFQVQRLKNLEHPHPRAGEGECLRSRIESKFTSPHFFSFFFLMVVQVQLSPFSPYHSPPAPPTPTSHPWSFTFLFLMVFNGLDDAYQYWWRQSSLLSLPSQMLMSSWRTLTDPPRSNVPSAIWESFRPDKDIL